MKKLTLLLICAVIAIALPHNSLASDKPITVAPTKLLTAQADALANSWIPREVGIPVPSAPGNCKQVTVPNRPSETADRICCCYGYGTVYGCWGCVMCPLLRQGKSLDLVEKLIPRER